MKRALMWVDDNINHNIIDRLIMFFFGPSSNLFRHTRKFCLYVDRINQEEK